MADPQNPSETFSEVTGRSNVNTDFLVPENDDTPSDTPPDNGTPDNQPETPSTPSTPSTPETPAQPETPATPSTPENGDQPPAPGTDPEKPPAPGTQPPAQPPKKYAGKYDSVDELKKAYQNLGGNPDRFGDDVAKLEEAYDYRQSEYTRIQQEQAERDRLNNQPTPETSQDPNQIVEGMLEKVDWTKVEDAKDLGKQLLTIFMQNMPKNTPQPTPEQMVERIAPLLQERERKQKALSYIEGKVPRLTKDQGFRRAFAFHVVGGRKDGTPYPRTNEGLDEAMKDFLQWGKSIADESAAQTQVTTQQKRDALPPREHGGDLPQPDQEDEIDEVIAYHKERQAKLGIR